MRKKEKIREILDRLERDIEKTVDTVDKRAQHVEDLVECLALQQHPGTTCCRQCKGAGKKREYRIRWHVWGLPSPYWQYTCDKCKGTGRVPTEKKKG